MYKALINGEPAFEESIARAAILEFLVDKHCQTNVNNSLLRFQRFGCAIDKLLDRLDIKTLSVQCIMESRSYVEILRNNGRINSFLAGFAAAQLPNELDCLNTWNQVLISGKTIVDEKSPTYIRLCKMAQNAFFETAFEKMMTAVEVEWISVCCGSLFLANEFVCCTQAQTDCETCFCDFCGRKGDLSEYVKYKFFKIHAEVELKRNGNELLSIKCGNARHLTLRNEEVRQDWMRQKVRMADMAWMTMNDLAFPSDVAWLCLQYGFHYLSE